jgi:rubrerythrin
MANEMILGAIKAAMKGELDSVAVYEGAASAADGELRSFFLERASEERKHYGWLLDYYRQIGAGKVPETDLSSGEKAGRSPPVSENFAKRVGGSRQLSAAVSAAVLLEAEGVRLYLARAEEAFFPVLKSFFEALAAWEDRHYHDLLKVQEESERWFWDANRFEPF